MTRGKRLYLRCVACHDIAGSGAPKIGPSLAGIVGKRAGEQPGYGYSKGLAAAGFVWDEARLHAWLTRPVALVPDTTMVFDGMTLEADRLALIAYLRTAR